MHFRALHRDAEKQAFDYFGSEGCRFKSCRTRQILLGFVL